MKKIMEIPMLILILIGMMLCEKGAYYGVVQVLRKRWKMIPLFFVWMGGVGCCVMMIVNAINH